MRKWGRQACGQIDFNKASKETKSLFDDLSSLDFIFLRLQAQYGVQLYERQAVIVFDEVQKCPAARQVAVMPIPLLPEVSDRLFYYSWYFVILVAL